MEEKPKLTEGFWLFSIPFVGLFFGYCYEFGYSQYFHIPTPLIAVDLNSIASIILGLLLYPIYIYGLDYFVSFIRDNATRKIKDPERLKELTFGFFFILIVLVYFVIRTTENDPFEWGTMDYIYAALFAAYVFFIVRLLIKKSNPARSLKPQHPEQETRTYLSAFIGRSLIKTILLLVLLSGLCLYYGHRAAMRQKDFYRIGTDTEFVGIKIYGNRLVGSTKDEILRGNTIHLRVRSLPDVFEIATVKRDQL
jgi:hypothetical protein